MFFSIVKNRISKMNSILVKAYSKTSLKIGHIRARPTHPEIITQNHII